MSQQELVKTVVEVFNKNHIPYMFTGSVVSSLQGHPRSTHDIDVVVQIFPENVEDILMFFSFPDYFVQGESVQKAIKEKGMFNILDVQGGDKIDCWLLTDTAFDESRFARKKEQKLFGLNIFVSSPEDTILAKLYWSKLSGGSEKQFLDALRIYEVQYKLLDFHYIRKWVKELNVEDLWNKILNTAEV